MNMMKNADELKETMGRDREMEGTPTYLSSVDRPIDEIHK